MVRRSVRMAGARRRAPTQLNRVDAARTSTGGKRDDSHEGVESRRSFLVTGGSYLAGVASGVLGSYGTAYLSAVVSPSELADARSGSEPVRAVVVPERDQGIQGERWIYPGPISLDNAALQAISNPSPTYEELHNRLRNRGFLDAEYTLFKLSIEGRRNSPVRVIDIEPHVVNRRPPSPLFSSLGPGPQGSGSSIGIGYDLDEQIPAARKINPMSDGPSYADYFAEPFFGESNTQLARGEQEIYQVIARTFRWDVEWFLRVSVLVAGQSDPIVVQVGNGEKPFRTVAYPDPDVPQNYSERYVINLELSEIKFVHCSPGAGCA